MRPLVLGQSKGYERPFSPNDRVRVLVPESSTSEGVAFQQLRPTGKKPPRPPAASCRHPVEL
jgi:hypothetical protein